MTLKKLILWFGIIGSMASIISLIYVFTPSNENIKLHANTESIEGLTQNFGDDEPNLKVNYKFKGIDVKNLWKYNIRFQNKSKKTIIANGNQKNILMDNLTFKLKKGYKILDYKQLKSDFNSNITVDSTNVKIFFQQWRENEILEYSFYVRTDISLPDTILLEKPKFRQIIDGDILFNQNKQNQKKERITQFVPGNIRLFGYIISFIFLGIIIIMLIVITFSYPFSFFKIYYWRRKYHLKYTESINTFLEEKYLSSTKYISKDPQYVDDEFWLTFDGEKYPNTILTFEYYKIYQFTIVIIILIILNFSFIMAFLELFYLL